MPISARYPDGRSQHFTFPRRELFQKAMSAALLYLVPSPQPLLSTLSGRPLPEFRMGDLIEIDWTGEFGEDFIEFGEIVGICHRPEDGWVYYINWLSSTSSDDFQYPCFEGEPTTGDRMRLVRHV
ncbi:MULTISPECIES: hypothetical protein [unclassified Microcoleus]|uniref:hypothetical protein n=1 Tax=unclassified Microcoleus TaxID=2642155 RepID=UPI002FD25A9C